MVDFCKKCGAIIIGKKNEEISCLSCGNINKNNSEIKLTENIKTYKEIEIVDNDNSQEIYPTTPVECPKCGNNEAYYWTKQTRAGDEPETQFFKCVACKHQWRDYR